MEEAKTASYEKKLKVLFQKQEEEEEDRAKNSKGGEKGFMQNGD